MEGHDDEFHSFPATPLAATSQQTSQSELSVSQSSLPLDPSAMEHERTLEREQLTRNFSFFGEDGMAKIRGSFVVVVVKELLIFIVYVYAPDDITCRVSVVWARMQPCICCDRAWASCD
jgi:hypothetical protein